MSQSTDCGHHNVGEGSRGVEEEVELGEGDGSQPDGDVASKPGVRRCSIKVQKVKSTAFSSAT